MSDTKRPANSKSTRSKADDENAVLAKIAEMPERDRLMGERLHAIKASAPNLSQRGEDRRTREAVSRGRATGIGVLFDGHAKLVIG